MTKSLPSRPDIEWLKKAAKQRLIELRAANPAAKLYQAQLDIARDYGFASWRALSAHVDALSLDGQLIRAVQEGRADDLGKLLSEHPAKLTITGGAFNRLLLHHAAEAGHGDCVRVILDHGFDINTRDRLDHATALHWAAEAGRLDIVRRLLDAGADPDGEGDEHEGGVIGWATALHSTRKDVAELLLSRGARPTIFAAVALGRGDLVRKLVEEDPAVLDQTQSRFERHRTSLHLAVMKNLPEMVSLLIELGADVSAKDSAGASPLKYAAATTGRTVIDLLIEAGADPVERGNLFEGATPQLDVKSLPAAIAYFTDKLGFEKEWEAPSIACVFRDQVYLFLSTERRAATGSIVTISVRDVDGLYEEYKSRGAIIREPPTDRPWGGRVMTVLCPDGNVLSYYADGERTTELR